MQYTIFPVITKRDLKNFVELPYQIYKTDPNWVPPFRTELAGQFDPDRNPFLNHCTYVLYLLRDGQRIVGRIAAFIDHLAVEAWQENIGLFGYFECCPDESAARLLLQTASDWLNQNKMEFVRGPWSFVSQEWGSVVEGFSPPPVVMSPYNPPLYNQHFEQFGLEKVKDLLVFVIDADSGYVLPERILTLTNKISQRYGIHTRCLSMTDLDHDVEKIIQLSNICLLRNWGYSPVTDDEVRAMVNDLKQIIHPKGVIFAEDLKGNSVGFAIAIPDINMIIKNLNGKLFPVGWLTLLRKLPKIKQYRMFALGVIPEYQQKGIDSLLYRALYESLFQEGFRMEINYVLEDNMPMNNAIRKLGAKPLRRYRVFQKSI